MPSAFIYLLFFASGFTSLVFENIWVRTLSLAVGSTATALSVVLTIFFLGLATGSVVASRYVDKARTPLLLYGKLEGLAGALGFLLFYIFLHYHYYLRLLPLEGSLAWLGSVLKYAPLIVLLYLPSCLMGASLPILVKIFADHGADAGKKVSRLYAINTIGGAAGAFATGYLLIPYLGLEHTSALAAVVNLLVLAGSYLARGFQAPLAAHAPKPQEFPTSSASLLAASFFCGLASLSAEVAWNKYLGIFLGSNIFGLSIVLTLFLLGIAIGAFLVSYVIDKVQRPHVLLIALTCATGVSIFLSTKILSHAPTIAGALIGAFPNWSSVFLVKTLVSTLILVVPTSIMGALLPLCIRLLPATSAHSASGRVYACNTLGAILGSFLSGILLIPLLGSGTTVFLSSAIPVLAALYLWVRLGGKMPIAAAALVATALAAMFYAREIDFTQILRSAYFQTDAQAFAKAMKNTGTDEEFRFIVEGKTGIISISHDKNDGENYRDYLRLKTNGLNESIYNLKHPAELPKYEAMLGLLPLALARNPKNAFVVGYGGGYTVDLLTSNQVPHVLVAELEAGILQAADFAHGGSNPILKRKNIELRIEDARFSLATKQGGPYDIIISQPSHSWLLGVANLFTKQFFYIVKENLSEHGVYAQWLNLYNMNADVLRSILRTFYTEFPHGMVFTNTGDDEIILVGSKTPVAFDLNKLNALIRNPANHTRLRTANIQSGHDLLTQFALTREEALTLAGDAMMNSDRNAYAEVSQSRIFYGDQATLPMDILLKNYRGDFTSFVKPASMGTDFAEKMLEAFQRQTYSFYKIFRVFERLQAEANQKKTPEAFLRAAGAAFDLELYATGEKLATKAATTVAGKEKLAQIYLGQTEWAKAAAVAKSGTSQQLRCMALEAGLQLKKPEQVRDIALAVEKNYQTEGLPCGITTEKLLGMYYNLTGEYKKAVGYLQDSYERAQNDVVVYKNLVSSLTQTNSDPKFLGELIGYYQTFVQAEHQRIDVLAEFYRDHGYSEDHQALQKRKVALYGALPQ